ncbi:OLC1v1034576C1 [Oldenlandia corymbosa var. corymbosa]|uniref:OLC1v1034576C1 n=1 Tax=Oldenlandia corymbosa var. corymbosa TaxID=529605 RepID=A0AAV1CTS9_OLDCO|nr:OLC1v1034576C1 [Oldenlandia corymbosa var. corymbosa]
MDVNHHQQRSPLSRVAEEMRQIAVRALLAVEDEARQIVNAAKSGRAAKLLQARQEAEIEVAGFRAEMELEFLKLVTMSSEDSAANFERLEQDAETKIYNLKSVAVKVHDDVASRLLQCVVTVRV